MRRLHRAPPVGPSAAGHPALLGLFALSVACTSGGGAPPPASTPGAAGPPPPSVGPAAFHEQSWEDVAARALSHLAAQGRDLARAGALRGDWSGCAERYQATAAELRAVALREPSPLRIRDAYAGALERDAAWCEAQAEGRPPPLPSTAIARLYAERAAARISGRPFEPGPPPLVRTLPLSVDDPTARSALRADLTEAWADSVDPGAPSDPWGYWEPAQVLVVHARLSGVAPAARAWSSTAEELATPPTGDSYVDSAGLPGPRARFPPGVGVPDEADRALAARLSAAPPAEVPAQVTAAVAVLDDRRAPDRDRRVQGLRNAVLRRLAAAEAWAPAAALARTMRLPRDFDRECIDRSGVVIGIEGRLLLLAGDPTAEAVLEEAAAATRAFLRDLPG